jgi:hypothetical protein
MNISKGDWVQLKEVPEMQGRVVSIIFYPAGMVLLKNYVKSVPLHRVEVDGCNGPWYTQPKKLRVIRKGIRHK